MLCHAMPFLYAMPCYATLSCDAMRCYVRWRERVVGADIEELVYVYMAFFFNFTTFHSPGAHLEADCVWNKRGLNSSYLKR